MKTRLLYLLAFAVLSVQAQTTHDLNWFTGIGNSVDLTIDLGDTVRWTWTDALPHTVENVVGNSVETFNSGVLTGNGMQYSYTFTVEGANDYFCGIHGAASMSGTITVQNNLSIDDQILNSFTLINNSKDGYITIKLPANLFNANMLVHDMLGKQVMLQNVSNQETLQVDVSVLNQGIYLITIQNNGVKQTKRFVRL